MPAWSANTTINIESGANISNLEALITRAAQHLRGNRLEQCLDDCKTLLLQQPKHPQALELSAIASFRLGDVRGALNASWQLVETYPDEPAYCDRLAQLAERGGKPEEGSKAYEHLLSRRPEEVTSRFNHARLLRSRGLNEEALLQYRRCLKDGIQQPEEIQSNMGVILSDLHRSEEAEVLFQNALTQAPDYIPALYNLALLLEERGDWPAAREHFTQILKLDPYHQDAAARLVQGQVIESAQDPALKAVRNLLEQTALKPEQRESLYYALGKGLDDCGQYRDAFAAYQSANELSRRRVPAYDQKAQEVMVEQVLRAQVLDSLEPVSERPLIFICGMFRSGSTLLEQMLAGHTALQSGGEIGFISGRADLPAWSGSQFRKDWQRLGRDYLDHLDANFSTDKVVLDKRPDNLFFLPMLARLFPSARFLRTTRQTMDNCLAVYFQQLGSDFTYANRLSDTAHYLQCQQGFMSTLEETCADQLYTISYEELIANTRETLAGTLNFLGLPWDEGCLEYASRAARVRTASVSQVRRPIYATSVNRWRNYENELRASSVFSELLD
ncbi:MAG: sulfotransferase [Halioglobus sp.]